jgi:hypothetical protein
VRSFPRRGSIEYDATTTLTSFESALVKNKIRAHFQAAVERIVAAKPDVLLVGASVDQMAIAMLEVSPAGGFVLKRHILFLSQDTTCGRFAGTACFVLEEKSERECETSQVRVLLVTAIDVPMLVPGWTVLSKLGIGNWRPRTQAANVSVAANVKASALDVVARYTGPDQ